jgi:DNA repair protein RadB
MRPTAVGRGADGAIAPDAFDPMTGNPSEELPAARSPTGSAPVDSLLGGGLEPDGITQLYGEGGTGKTILCLEATVRTLRSERWVAYIDTEGLSMERLQGMGGPETPQLLRHLLLTTPRDLAEQTAAVSTACGLVRDGQRPVGLLVVDSATLHYRLSLGTDQEEEARRELVRELSELLATAISHSVPVLLTNQVYYSPATGQHEPLGGPWVNHASKTILRFDRLPGSRRRVVLVKHRSRPESAVVVRITARGLESEGGASDST